MKRKARKAIGYRASGRHLSHGDAEKVGRLCESLGVEMTPRDVLDAARPEESPIHHLFEWDDTEAAEKYRLAQARNIVNHILVVIDEKSGRTTKAFHSVVVSQHDDHASRVYMHALAVATTEDARNQVIANAFNEVKRWRDRYADYKDVFGGIFKVVDKLDKEIGKAGH